MDYGNVSGLSAAWLDELKSKVDIVQLISSSVPLTRKGNLWWGCCPFHHEKTPSFAVDERRGFFHCYGCHEGGDVISWVQKTDSLDFMDAVKFLARTVGMPVPETPRDNAKYREKDRLYEMMREAARHYYDNFERTPLAKQYMLSRGLRPETLRAFGIGYSVGGQALIDCLRAKGYTLREMSDCSLIGTNAERGEHYDFLAGRVIVPIFDAQGRVIAFGGRVLEKKEGVAKYKNSRETVLFQKNRTLYGLNFVKKYRLRHPVTSLIIVEGYMDVIALVEAGFHTAVASMGTALTDSQAALIKRMVDKVYISYDGDAAGQNNTMRGLDILKKAGLEVRVVNLPDGLDPDELIRQRGREAYQRCLDEALPLYEHKIVRVGARYDLTSADARGAYAKECLRIIADLDVVEQDAYLDMIAERTAVSKEALVRMQQHPPRTEDKEEAPVGAPETTDAAIPRDKVNYYKACRMMLMLMLMRPDYTDDWLPAEYYESDAHRAIATHVLDCMVSKEPIVPGNIYHVGADEKECNAVLSVPMPTDAELPQAYRDCRACIRRQHLQEQRRLLLDEYNNTDDPAVKEALKTQINRIMAELAKK